MNLKWMKVLGIGLSLVLVAAARSDAQENASNNGWLARVDATKSGQPHWITPLVTVTPCLEEEVRFDFFHHQDGAGAAVDNFGGSKGLELIPARRIEIILGYPPYLTHTPGNSENGWGDTNFLFKYRLYSSSGRRHNGIVTLFLGASAPTATRGNGTGHWIWTPAIATGKGWRTWDVQSTVGVSIPSGERGRLGTPLIWNVALQRHVCRIFWPELEMNSTYWPNGMRAGEKQVFLTPGLVVGKIRLFHCLGLTIGAGFQSAVTQFHIYNHAWVISVRTPF